MSLKILQLSKKFPYPLKDGESIAINYLSRALVSLGCEITLLTMNTTKHFVEMDTFPESCDHYEAIYSIEVDNKIKILDAFLNLFSKKSYHISRFISIEYSDKLKELLQSNNYDIIQLETLYLTPYIPIIKEYSGAKICMRAHNIEYEIWERLTANNSSVVKKWYLSYLTQKLRKYEISHLNDYDFLATVSERDLLKFRDLGYQNPGMSSPIGLLLNRYKPREVKENNNKSLCFIGALDWLPNQEGLEWFIVKVWPIVSARNPHLQLHVAGRNMPDRFLQMEVRNLHFHGEVNDAISFINAHDIMIVPLLSGSGMRVKILEGMALGKPVISTQLGKEGIRAKDGKHFLIADTPIGFTEAIEKLLTNHKKFKKIGKKARNYIENNFDNQSVAGDLYNAYKYLINENLSSQETLESKLQSTKL